MNLIFKSMGAIVVMGAVAGCTGEPEPATVPGPSPAPAPKPGPKQNQPPPATKAGNEAPKAPAEAAPKPGEGPKVEGPKTSDAAKPDAKASKLSAKELAAVKELPAAEQDAAIAQGVCPVSNHNLGSMGMPLKVTAEGRTFYLCCDGCEDKLKADPKAVIAKLDKNKAGK